MSKRTYETLSRHRSITLPASNRTSLLPKQFSIPEKIGSGLTAEVYRCKHEEFGEICVKIINNSFCKTSLGEKLIRNQIEILEKLSHENIVKFIELCKHNERKIIVTEHCQGGDLEKIIKMRRKIGEKEALQSFSGIIEGCKYLLQKNIIHRDIKPANILFKGKTPKIADFGFAVKDYNAELMKTNVGSPLYMAPEALLSLDFSQKSEVFSLGILLYEMLTGKTPWSAVSERDLLFKIQTVKPSKIPHIQEKVWNLLTKCLNVDKKQRFTLKQLSKTVKDLIQQSSCSYSETYCPPLPLKYGSRQIFRETTNKTEQKDIKPLQKITAPKPKNVNKTICSDRFPSNLQRERPSTQQQNPVAKKQNNFRKNRPLAYQQKQEVKQVPKSTQYLQIAHLLLKINPRSYSFLPESLIMKLEFILQKYNSILDMKNEQQYKPKPISEISKDLMISEVHKCSSEKQLCEIIVGFIRRVLRLTKNYVSYKACVTDLDCFYRRVSEIAG